MKFQPDTPLGANVVSRHEAGRVWIAGVPFDHSLIVPWSGPVQAWGAASLAELLPAHFERLAALRPEVVIFGSGARLRFAPPALMRSLIDQRIGVETMDTGAACRTYNVLLSEGRPVVAALLLEAAAPAAA
ncbi:MAG: Mth938-like domain-containing protein [Rubrivivax sp.]|nr:Mth938-like domain-containing protein [Rubrivivax sp.]